MTRSTSSHAGRSRWPIAGAAATVASFAFLTVAAGGGGVALASSRAALSTRAKVPSSITVVINQYIPTVDGLYSNSAPVNQMIGASLTMIGARGGVVPDLASTWTSNSNATVWTFKLRPNLKFSNGAALTAHDVVFSYKTVIANPKSLQNYYVQPIKSITSHGSSAVVMTLSAPNAAWPTQTTLIPIEPAATYNAKTYATHPIGAGPYEVVSYNGTNQVSMTANPYYYGKKPAIKNAVVVYVPNSTTVLDGLESGQYDVGLLQGSDLAVAKAQGLKVTSIPSSQVIYLGYNVKQSSLTLKLRQAISYAIDRAALVKAILLGQGATVDQLFTPTVNGYDKGIGVPAVNLARARKLVADSGYKGQPIEFDYPAGYLPSPPELAQAIAGDLAAVGIKVNLKEENADTFLTAWATSKIPAMYLFSIQTTTLDAGGTFLYFDKLLNNGSNDPRLLSLYNAQSDDTNPATRLKSLFANSIYINEKAYYTPLFYGEFSYVYNKQFDLPVPPANGYPTPQAFTGG